MTPDEERDLEPFIQALAELLLAEERRRAEEQQQPMEPDCERTTT